MDPTQPIISMGSVLGFFYYVMGEILIAVIGFAHDFGLKMVLLMLVALRDLILLYLHTGNHRITIHLTRAIVHFLGIHRLSK